MKKRDTDTLRPEYDFANGVRGKYVDRLESARNRKGTNRGGAQKPRKTKRAR